MYLSLVETDTQRLIAYRGLFESALDVKLINDILISTQTEIILGNEKFKAETSALVASEQSNKIVTVG